MRIGGFTPLNIGAVQPGGQGRVLPDRSFGDTMRSAVDQVNQAQSGADELTQKLATGDVRDIHEVLLALEHASSSFNLTVQVRNKALEAYQEVMRMQV